MTGAGGVLLAGGGTGGHVFPSLAVADALRVASPHLAVAFVGTARGLEARLVPEAGWPLHLVDTPPLARRVSPALLRLPIALARATRSVASHIRAADVRAAVVFGGYVSVPLALAARLARIPLVVHEQNAVPGVANRLAARWATAVAATFPDSAWRFPDAARVTVTGNPVRPGLRAGDRAAALATFGLDPDRRTLLVFGGSQGAQRINDAVVASASRWREPARLQILHAAGARTGDAARAAWDEALARTPDLRVRCEPFLDRMDLAYAAADAVVARAGASTIAELTVLGLPGVLVPYPHATADHQTANARAVADAGGAVLVADSDFDADALVAAAEPLLTDPVRRERVAAAARALGRPDAAARVADLVLDALARRAAVEVAS
jgi:UDP-N-acetylglucosamine--N-acetylmuramyl-(pentapeptide) pyrophosphoryl-undecaprenol N-acetylglucosamine transferase